MKQWAPLIWPLVWVGAWAGIAPLAPGSVALTDPLEDCLDVPGVLCLEHGGKNFVVASGTVPDLALWHQFDKGLPVDESGNGHHLLDPKGNLVPVPAGPGVLGRGASAALDGRGYGVVKDSEALGGNCWTLAIWVYLLEDSVGSWRTLLHRGDAAERFLPAVLLAPEERRLHVRISAGGEDGVLDGSGILPLRRWTHVAVSCGGGVLRLFVNGQKDGEAILEDAASPAGDLHVGRDPWRAGTKSYLDDLRWYRRELGEGEIRALAFPGITGVGADAVKLGCTSCTLPEAVKACEVGHGTHLCSLQELFSGGFHGARVMGWLTSAAEVWYHNEQEPDAFTGVRRLGLCCAEA